MKILGDVLRAVDFLRDTQFWRDALSETIYLVAQPNGIGVALTAALLDTGHRLLRLACARSPRESLADPQTVSI